MVAEKIEKDTRTEEDMKDVKYDHLDKYSGRSVDAKKGAHGSFNRSPSTMEINLLEEGGDKSGIDIAEEGRIIEAKKEADRQASIKADAERVRLEDEARQKKEAQQKIQEAWAWNGIENMADEMQQVQNEKKIKEAAEAEVMAQSRGLKTEEMQAGVDLSNEDYAANISKGMKNARRRETYAEKRNARNLERYQNVVEGLTSEPRQVETAAQKGVFARIKGAFSGIGKFFIRKPIAETKNVAESPVVAQIVSEMPEPPRKENPREEVVMKTEIAEAAPIAEPEVEMPPAEPIVRAEEAPAEAVEEPKEEAVQAEIIEEPVVAEKIEKVETAVETAKELSNGERLKMLQDIKKNWDEMVKLEKEIKEIDKAFMQKDIDKHNGKKTMTPVQETRLRNSRKKLANKKSQLSVETVDIAQVLSGRDLRTPAAEDADYDRSVGDNSLEYLQKERLYNIALTDDIRDIFEQQVKQLKESMPSPRKSKSSVKSRDIVVGGKEVVNEYASKL